MLDFGIVMDVAMGCVGLWDCYGLRLVGGMCRGDSVRSWIEFEEVVAVTVFLMEGQVRRKERRWSGVGPRVAIAARWAFVG